jgi:DNA-binding beta-propeller fold protein YncE
VDTDHNQIIVANVGTSSILFFERDADGDVSPIRVIEGPQTGIMYPSGTTLDKEKDEIWVSNWGNHTATVYPRTAKGNVAPLHTIAASSKGKVAVGLVNPGSVSYDPVRKEILVNQ